ncbi:hypothetical protein CH275_09305 [Rhodococcus sp. 06-235-1A]|jgi:hypothetical protein|uniref:DUF2637 domain-containing protein n=1 Tax=Rhodococcus sp. 06-235-1A TaxID=2022508 RepID=UPI000B9A1A47|nr:DUF2637 domain-containing protein [Rhodococcus sp. 06-235-1A]OZD06414.1 hypothetical protein CH275_09305 [Rhodococcus sp. 06-235-1A]
MTNLTTIKRCAVIGNALIGISAFTKSGMSLWQLATASGYPTALGWVLPLVLDGMVILATLMLVVDASHRWFAWTLLILGSVASTAGNIVHVSMADYSSNFTVAALTAAAPPLVLLVTTHLMIQLVRLEAPAADDTSERQVALKSPTEAETAVLCVHVLKLASEGHELAAVATRTGLSVEVVDAVIAAAEDELQVAPEEDRYLAPA